MTDFANNTWRVRIASLILFILGTLTGCAQIGGKNSFDFLSVPNNSRLAGLGGLNVSLADRDVNLFSSNPALLGDTLAGAAAISYQFYVGDIGHAFFSYGHRFNKVGVLAFGIQHFNYRTIQGYDPNGLETTEIQAGETALLISKNHTIENFRLGVTVKTVFSNLAGYRASALMADIGGLFKHPDQQLSIGLAIKNLGLVTSEYTSTTKTKLPFDVQFGATLKPEHMPLRFSLTAFNLKELDVTYNDAAQDQEKPGAVKKILSHINLGTEILLHKNVTVLVGYNYFVHQALQVAGGGGAGVSLGFSAAIKAVEFVFSRSAYVVGNAGYCFTLSMDVNTLLRRR